MTEIIWWCCVKPGASIKPTAKPSITNPMKIPVTLVAWDNVSQPIKYGILTSIIDNRRPNGSELSTKIEWLLASNGNQSDRERFITYLPTMKTIDFLAAAPDTQRYLCQMITMNLSKHNQIWTCHETLTQPWCFNWAYGQKFVTILVVLWFQFQCSNDNCWQRKT